MKMKGYALGIVSAVSYGLIPIFILPIKQTNFSLDTTLFYRFFISALLLLPVLWYTKRKPENYTKRIVCCSFVGVELRLIVRVSFYGVRFAFTRDCIYNSLYLPCFCSTYNVFSVKKKLNRLTVLSLILAFSGVLTLSLKNNSFEINFPGLIVVLLSAFFYALYILIVNQTKIKLSGFKLTFFSFLFTSLYFLVKAKFLGDSLLLPNVNMLINFVVFAFVTTLISSLALVFAIKYIGSTPTAILGALEPVVAVAVSVLMFNEVLTINLIIGITLIIIAVIVNIISDSRKAKVASDI
ncbi:Predicted permease, DMT superfamily [Weeksella virosa]|uniref:DMT family transporter n=1 Tax=Weeksella virosa TaxID=1014 RepID=UPI000E0816D6|nr:DMT family transporter [Weeksella virosa]SUP54796.1 Predicted permease, DMT superfamily [Weeksella virosa]